MDIFNNEDYECVSFSHNVTKAILNWNVTGAREDEEDDPDWDPDNVIFAVHETEHNRAVSKRGGKCEMK